MRYQRSQWERSRPRKSGFYMEDDSESVISVALSKILLSEKNRRALARDTGKIQSMRLILERGGELPPLVLLSREEGYYEIEDGRHRFLAAEESGFTCIDCIIR